jgi:hypothetical protein
MTAASSPFRFACATLLGLLLALRLLGSSGYMPAVDHGSLTIVVCPDADLNAPLALGGAHHHHGKAPHGANVCPYAAAASLGAVGPGWVPLLAGILFGLVLLPRRAFAPMERSRERQSRSAGEICGAR